MFSGGFAPDYVLDRMEPYEIDIALSGLSLKERDSWEQTRQIVYSIFQVNSRDRLSPDKIFPLPWDSEPEQEEISESECERLKKMMDEFIKEKNNAGRFNNEASVKE